MVATCSNSFMNITDLIMNRKVTTNECRFSQAVGFILLFISIISFIFNIHSLLTIKKKQQISSRDRNLVIGMFISSLCVIVISVPSVVTQCLLCDRLCSVFICRLEGFNSFFNGCITMYMLVALSFVRYSTTANSSLSKNFQYQIKQYNFSLVILCFVLGSIWAIPPLFGYMSSYVPEGLGFHCGLNWFDQTLMSRIYFFLLFIGVYFLPLIIIIYVSIFIHRTIHRLTHLNSLTTLEMNTRTSEDLLRRHISDRLFYEGNQRLRYLYEDYHFVNATSISLIISLIAWTPYSIIALAQVFGNHFFLSNPWIMTISALLAKLSMIINPIIYTIILRNREITLVLINN